LDHIQYNHQLLQHKFQTKQDNSLEANQWLSEVESVEPQAAMKKNLLPQQGDKCQLNPLLLITARGGLHTEVRDQQTQPSHQSAEGSSTTTDNAEPTGEQHYFGRHQSQSQEAC
jgi:hypothetical protein